MVNTSEHEAAVRAYYEYVDAEAYEELFALFTDDIIYHRPGHEPIEGKAAFEQFYHEVRDLEDGTHTIHELVVDGDTIAVRGGFEGQIHGGSITLEFADFHTFNSDGKIHTRHTFTDQGSV